MERLRALMRQSNADIGRVFNRFAQRGSDKISSDELLIAMSRVSDNIHLADIKDLYRIMVGAAPGALGDLDDVKVPINEVVQMLTL